MLRLWTRLRPQTRLLSHARQQATKPIPRPKLVVDDRHRSKWLNSLSDEFFCLSMLDVLLSQGRPDPAEQLFNVYRRDGHQFSTRVYNQLLLGWVEQGNQMKVDMLFRTMAEDGIVPNSATYAVLLYNYAKTDNMSAIEVDHLITEMESKGHKLEHVVYTNLLTVYQTKRLLSLLERRNITPIPPPPKKVSLKFPKLLESYYSTEHCSEDPSHSFTALLDSKVLKERVAEQLEIEKRGYLEIPSIVSRSHKGEEVKASVTLNKLLKEWEKALVDSVNRVKRKYKHIMNSEYPRNPDSIPKYYPFLASLKSKQWASFVINFAVIQLLQNPDGFPVSLLCNQIVRPAWRMYVVDQKRKAGSLNKMEQVYNGYIDYMMSPRLQSQFTARDYWKHLDSQTISEGTIDKEYPMWPFEVSARVGGALLRMLLDTAMIDEETPAFRRIHEKSYQKTTGYLVCHHKLIDLFKKLDKKDIQTHFKMNAFEVPMLVPPRPWTYITEGGYLALSSQIARCASDSYQYHLLLHNSDNMKPVFDSLNYLSSCPWSVNTRILDIVIDLFNKNDLSLLEQPSQDVPELPSVPIDCDDFEIKMQVKRIKKEIKKLRNESFSLKMTLLYRLSLANFFRDKVFWLPQNMDFRSRVYPIPPHLNHLSSDLSRGLVKPGIGHPLGERGLMWLKVHLANLYGTKSKAALKERIAFADEMIDEIFDSADNPLTGNGWWKKSDEPWQTLACCMELAAALRSPSPTEYISHIYIHQDGSCNGLQHYAALGRDSYGAKQVNLVPGDEPEDLYSEVARLVNVMRAQDCTEGSEDQKKIAILLEGKVTRKVVKTPVMTVVYGVTYIGGRLMIEKQLKDSIPRENLYQCSIYLIDLVFKSLAKMFSNAREIQDWFTISARKIAKAGRPVEWTTPLGMPVAQPYHMNVIKSLSTPLQRIVSNTKYDIASRPNTTKQKNGMPPNFVHSLDSTHMMLTALYCHKAGVPFAAVHDSYWTHPVFVDKMNKICREQFVAMHSQPILDDLADNFEEIFGGLPYREKDKKSVKVCQFKVDLPSRGDFDLSQVVDSTYFFS